MRFSPNKLRLIGYRRRRLLRLFLIYSHHLTCELEFGLIDDLSKYIFIALTPNQQQERRVKIQMPAKLHASE